MRVCGVGDNVVDRYLGLDRMYPGGNALNVAVFCRRAGVEAAYLGITGSDEAGALVRESLVAEGVETAEQLAFLEKEQCDTVQGYYFYKPMVAEEIKGILQTLR